MVPLSTHDLLTAWDLGQANHPVDRALTLLSVACPEAEPQSLAGLSVGQRDAALLRLREITFGRRLSGLADCPGCGERLELDLDTRQLSAQPLDRPALFVDTGGYHIEFRLPNSLDLAAVREAPNGEAGRDVLLERCITNGATAAELPEPVVGAIAEAMSQADPQGDVRLALDCPACGRHWEELFDIASFLWAEVHAWAMRAFREVHQIASAYGWREEDILAMSRWRKQVYLELLGG